MRKMLVSALGLCLVASAAWALQKAGAKAPAGDSGAIAQLAADFVAGANAKDATRMAATYDENAVVMPPNGPAVRGRENIRAYWQGMLEAGARDVALTPTGSAVSGAVGFEAGTYAFTMQAAGGQAVKDEGKYLVGVRKGKDGKWKITHDIFNSDLPCPPPPAK